MCRKGCRPLGQFALFGIEDGREPRSRNPAGLVVYLLAGSDPLQNTRSPAFTVHGLGTLIRYARDEFVRVKRFALA